MGIKSGRLTGEPKGNQNCDDWFICAVTRDLGGRDEALGTRDNMIAAGANGMITGTSGSRDFFQLIFLALVCSSSLFHSNLKGFRPETTIIKTNNTLKYEYIHHG